MRNFYSAVFLLPLIFITCGFFDSINREKKETSLPIYSLRDKPQILAASFSVIPLKLHKPANLYTVTAKLEGKPCRLLLDTGASHTTFALEFMTNHFPKIAYQQLQLSTGSNVASSTQKFTITDFQIGEKARFGGFAGAVTDLGMLTEAFGEPIDGILGMNVMGVFPFVLSCREATFQWVSALEREHFTLRELYGELDDVGCFMLHAKLREETVPLVVDSGATASFVSLAHWTRKRERPVKMDFTTINSTGKQNARYVGIPEILMLGPGVMMREMSPVIFEETRNGIFGTDYLRKLDILIDAPVNKAYAVEKKRSR